MKKLSQHAFLVLYTGAAAMFSASASADVAGSGKPGDPTTDSSSDSGHTGAATESAAEKSTADCEWFAALLKLFGLDLHQ
ncbi:MAG: hypothetical protein MJA83_13455 [Gammaproteobacteria bacterium]|nr:hypothetical protein [Gammaproteobacteria bacterium]